MRTRFERVFPRTALGLGGAGVVLGMMFGFPSLVVLGGTLLLALFAVYTGDF